MSNLNEILELIQQDEKEAARSGLMTILETDRNNEFAWLYMAACATNKQEFSLSIQRVLEINPSNGQALQLAQKYKIPLPDGAKAQVKQMKKAKKAQKSESGSSQTGCVRVLLFILIVVVIVAGAFFAFTQMGSDTPADGTEAASQDVTEEATGDAIDATEEATVETTEEATEEPTKEPTEEPTEAPTEEPTEAPTEEPTEEPTEDSGPAVPLPPTAEGTGVASAVPEPTDEPTIEPTEKSQQTAPPTPAAEDDSTDVPTEEATEDTTSNSGLPPTPTPEGEDGIGGGGDLSAGPAVLSIVYDENSAYLLNISEEDQDVTALKFIQGDIVSELSNWFVDEDSPFILAPGECYQIGITDNAATNKPADCSSLLATGVDESLTHFWVPASDDVDEFEIYADDSLLAFCAFSEGSCDFGLPVADSE